VTVQQRPAFGWQFAFWGGACSGTGACVVSLGAPQTVVAYYQRPQQKLTITVRGFGTVTGPGINCGADTTCTYFFPFGYAVTITQQPAGNARFIAWGDDCGNSVSSCTLTFDGDKNATAIFTPQ
jgi:hypothetical protein